MALQSTAPYDMNTPLRGWTTIAGAVILLLAVLSVTYPPYSAIAIIAGSVGVVLLLARPDIAFALFFAAETLISEDVLLITERLKPTLYYYTVPGLGLNPFEIALLALVAATLLHRKGRLYGTRLDGVMIGFGLACLLGYITCIRLYGDPGRLFEPRRLLHFYLAYFLTVNLIRSKQALKMFLMVFFAAVALKGLQGVFLYTLGEGLQIKWKIRAIFTGWGDSLNFVTMLLILAAFVLDRAPLPAKRLWLVATPIVLFSFLFSYKRAYYVALVVGLLVLFLMQKGRARVRFMTSAFVGFLLLLILITAAGQWRPIGMRFESILNPTKESSANYRLVEWQNALISIRKNPTSGIGLGGVMPMEIYLSRTNLLGVHNTYLWVAVKMGAVGLFAYLLLQLAFVKRLLRQNQALHDPFLRTLSRGLTCVFAAFCAAQMFAPMFIQMRTSTWFGVILGIGMLLSTLDQRHAPEQPETLSQP
ncbi:MAG: O-antigen ligase family protein [Candidatus Hinthialibacter antarcticus]|nr:O-antigen ligase family protein [Candidatus Hinthialibacter antarcticus]